MAHTHAATIAAPPDAQARKHAYWHAKWPEREALHAAIAAHKAEVLERRRALGRYYLEEHHGAIDVAHERAVARVCLVDETRLVREEAIAVARDRTPQHTSPSLQYLAMARDFGPDSATIRLATSPLLLAPITRYCGMWPVLFNLFVTRAYQGELKAESPHHFHLDPEDVISFKVFIPLNDVDDDCGPFHALPADLTQGVLRAVDYTGVEFLTDERVAEVVGPGAAVKLTGPAGTVGLADTTRCLHFGGRPRTAGKPPRDTLVFQYLLPTSLLYPVDGDSEQPCFLPQLEATGDAHWDALIGAILT